MRKKIQILCVIGWTVILTACGGATGVNSGAGEEIQGSATPAITKTADPYENVNRKILEFNFKVDEYVLRPVAVAYKENIPKPVQNGLGNFFSNLRDPFNSINNLLQGKPIRAGQDLSRFVINSTLGIAGFADVATPVGIPKSDEDFGQTMAVWGVPSGPYIVLPLLGPSNIRDAVGTGVQMTYGDVTDYIDLGSGIVLTGVRLVDTRANLLGVDRLLDGQADKYVFLREFYNENRYQEVFDLSDEEILQQQQKQEDELLDELLFD